jgi:hypothetical protein
MPDNMKMQWSRQSVWRAGTDQQPEYPIFVKWQKVTNMAMQNIRGSRHLAMCLKDGEIPAIGNMIFWSNFIIHDLKMRRSG